MSNFRNIIIHGGLINTWATKDEVSKGDQGYFGNTIQELWEAVEQERVMSVSDIYPNDPSICFVTQVGEQTLGFSMFLPEEKAHGFAPFEKFSEFKEVTGAKLFDTVTLRQRIQGLTEYFIIRDVRVSCFYGKTPKLKTLCGIGVQELVAMYEVKNRDGKWVPCGKIVED